MKLLIGNDHALFAYKDEEGGPWKYKPLPGNRVTEVRFPPSLSVEQAMNQVTKAIFPHHIEEGFGPAWVEPGDEDSVELANMLAEEYEIETERPEDWDQ